MNWNLLFDFYKEEMVTEEEVDGLYGRTVDALEDLELRNMLRQEEDPMDAVLKNQFRCGRYGKSGLGVDADAHVHALGGIPWL